MLHLRDYQQRDLEASRLTLIASVGKTKSGELLWLCVCRCGNRLIVHAGNITSGHTRSCGCLMLERARDANTKHGEASIRSGKRTVEYSTWAEIKRRCYNKNCHSYKEYGARGITMCEAWKDSFKTFLSDMGRRPSALHSIERNKVNEGYSPDNCRWATRSEQNRNTRRNRFIEIDGETRVLMEWAERSGTNRATIAARIDILGWTPKEAVFGKS